MKQSKIISLPTNEKKIYRQILVFLGSMLNITAQERDVLAELIRLDNEYEMLPPDKRGKFILSTDMRKEMREVLDNMKEEQFNVIIHRLKNDTKKFFIGKPLIGEDNIVHPDLKFKPDEDGFRIEINLIMTTIPQRKPEEQKEIVEVKEEPQSPSTTTDFTPPAQYMYDASQAPVIEEEIFDFTINDPNE